MKSELFKDRHITVSYFDEGERVNFQESVKDEDFLKICELIKVDDIQEHLTDKNSISISLQTPEQHREFCIQGVMFGDNTTRKIAENIVDGVEMTDEEYERLSE